MSEYVLDDWNEDADEIKREGKEPSRKGLLLLGMAMEETHHTLIKEEDGEGI